MRISPLEIPLIQDLICSHLDPPALAACVRVCQAWHHLFEPYLWQEIVIPRRATLRKFSQPHTIKALSVQLGSYQDRDPYRIRSISTRFTVLWKRLLPLLQHSGEQHPANPRLVLSNLRTIQSLSFDGVSPNKEWNHLELDTILPFLSPDITPRLNRLELEGFKNRDLFDKIMAAVRAHPALCHFSLKCPEYLSNYSTQRALWYGHRLESQKVDAKALWDFGSPFDPTQEMEKLGINTMEDWESIPAFKQELTLPGALCLTRMHPDWQPVYLKTCRNMTQLVLHWLEKAAVEGLESILVRKPNPWPHLVHLHIGDAGRVNAHEMARILGALQTPLESLKLFQFDGQGSMEQLDHVLFGTGGAQGGRGQGGHHLQSLVSIAIAQCPAFSSEWIQRFLVRCPKLESFEAMEIHLIKGESSSPFSSSCLQSFHSKKASFWSTKKNPFLDPLDMEEESWGCTRLKRLRLQFLGMNDRRLYVSFPTVLAEQLGRMTMLQDLCLERMPSTDWDPSGVLGEDNDKEIWPEPNMSMALSHLAHLQDLERLELKGLYDFIDRLEFLAIKKQWPKIKRGFFHDD